MIATTTTIPTEQAEVCLKKTRKSNARTRRYAAARQLLFRQRRMERKAHVEGLVLHIRCACGCGLTIKPSLKRPFARGHNQLAVGVLRVISLEERVKQ